MIRRINVGIEPSYDCYDKCVSARRCEALKAWKRAKAKKNKVIEEVPSAEAKTKCIAQIKVDTEELVRRIKEEYDIADGWIPVSDRLPEKDGYYLVPKDDKRFFNALKPSKEIDRSWGIDMKVPVCPNCEAIISPMCFWKNCGDKVGWCEYCGQKIDWSGWEDE